ncbi:MAG: hypothetical protein FJ397_05755 [Verrucomicrobia bacterium]|nr:hypothetical protein [Verrucomicrobiota bacterium]
MRLRRLPPRLALLLCLAPAAFAQTAAALTVNGAATITTPPATQVTVYDSRGPRIAGNSVWTRNDDQDDNDHDDDQDDDDKSSDIEEASDRSGAWRLPRGTSDSALLLTLAPGVYTVHVTGVRGASGIGLVEVFEVR